jgi:hypothetical protein
MIQQTLDGGRGGEIQRFTGTAKLPPQVEAD